MVNAGLANNNNAFPNQAHWQNQKFYDRPSSSASSHSQQQQSSPFRQPSSSTDDASSQASNNSRRPFSVTKYLTSSLAYYSRITTSSDVGDVPAINSCSYSPLPKAHRGDSMMNGFNNSMGVKPPNQHQFMRASRMRYSQYLIWM